MKTSNYLRCAIALIFSFCSMGSWAEEIEVINENFNNFEWLTQGDYPNYRNWCFNQCQTMIHDSYYALKIYNNGSATTPTFGKNGNAILSFSYAAAKASSTTSLSVSLTGGGTINETITNFSNSSQSSYNTATLHITGATETTQVIFTAITYDVAIDDVIINVNTQESFTVAPTLTPDEGFFMEEQKVTMNCETDGATIYYTTDGSTPTNESTEYTGEITVDHDMVVKAIAYAGGTASNVTTAHYFVHDYLFADAFTNEDNKYWVVNTNNTYTISNQTIGKSAILSLDANGNNELTVNVVEDNKSIHSETIIPTAGSWNRYHFRLPMFKCSNNVYIYILSLSCNIDNVELKEPATITLSQNSNNNVATISENLNQIVDVSTDRRLFAGVCHTMCLPFDIKRSDMNIALGESFNPLLYTFNNCSGTTMSFTEIGNNGTITAGTPFLLKVDKGFENLKFYAVKITASTPTDVTYDNVTFKGTFNPTDLATDGTDLFLGTDNYLYIPASATKTLGGLRAYIYKPKGARLGITFNDEAAAIDEVTVPAVDSPLYNLQGQRIVQPRSKSLYIKNGKKMIQQ